MDFVADASVTLPWVLRDESTSWTDRLLLRIQSGDTIYVPAHWPVEMSNGLLMAQRRKRIPPGNATSFWDFAAQLAIETDPPLSYQEYKQVLAFAERHTLTVYDAIYLQHAQRLNLPLATQNGALIRAAQREGTPLLSAP